MNFLPLYDKIVAIKIKSENKIGDIYLPDNENSILKAKVIEVGNGKLLDNGNIKELIVKKNDKILFKDSYNIEKYKEDNEEFYFLKENDIIAIIK